ncbi:hypothetical protein TNCV_4792071 [Trichonephila clavipes]|nr:hypothetical protein TNCV_4792071 [Trichonephila clavipes]
METFRKCKQACVDALKQMPDHYPEEPFFVRALTELQEIEETISMAVSDIDLTTHVLYPWLPTSRKKLPIILPSKLTQSTPKVQTQNNSYGKRKDSSNWNIPQIEKLQEKLIFESPDKEETIVSPNKFNIPKELHLTT